MFGRKKTGQPRRLSFDPQKKKPVIRCNTCNRDRVGCLRDLATGELEEIMPILDDYDLQVFKKMCGTEDIPEQY